jgi:hypothetical protein
MTRDTAAVAERLAATLGLPTEAYLDALEELLADEVLVTRVPPRLEDGPVAKRALLENERAVTATFRRFVPDYHQEDGKLVVVGPAAVRLDEVMTGTLPDGNPVRIPVAYRFGVRDGVIDSIEMTWDPADAAPMTELFRAGGASIPNPADGEADQPTNAA